MQAVNMPFAITLPQLAVPRISEPRALAILYSNRKAPVLQTAVPQASVLSSSQDFQYAISYLTALNDAAAPTNPEAVVQALQAALPRWVNMLCTCSNGYKNRIGSRRKKGTTAGLLKRVVQTGSEQVYAFESVHLDVFVSVLVQKPRKESRQENVFITATASLHTERGAHLFALLKPMLEYSLPKLLKKAVAQQSAS